tara:strand:+ start:901 stop:1473 length:573 start_codon:yes stop_codon:yes gene_type:complete
MCDNWRKTYFKKYACCGTVYESNDGDIVIRGNVKSKSSNPTIVYWAASPPGYVTSYSGAGLPYANPDIAYEKTPNKGSVHAVNGEFEFHIKYPNSYYAGLGTAYVPPAVHIKVCDGNDQKIHTIKLGNGIPFRLQTYPSPPEGAPRCSPMFYDTAKKLPVRTQEQILVDSGYPSKNEMPDNFWGLKPPHP